LVKMRNIKLTSACGAVVVLAIATAVLLVLGVDTPALVTGGLGIVVLGMAFMPSAGSGRFGGGQGFDGGLTGSDRPVPGWMPPDRPKDRRD
jgi:hypothetical protein